MGSLVSINSSAGTNLKVGAPVRSEVGGGTDPSIFLVVSLHFLPLKAQLVVW